MEKKEERKVYTYTGCIDRKAYDDNGKIVVDEMENIFYNYPSKEKVSLTLMGGVKSAREYILNLNKDLEEQNVDDDDLDKFLTEKKTISMKDLKLSIFDWRCYKIKESAKILKIFNINQFYKYTGYSTMVRSFDWEDLSKKWDVVMIDTQQIKETADERLLPVNLPDTRYFNSTILVVLNYNVVEEQPKKHK